MTSSDSRDAHCSRTPRSLEQRVADREERFRRAHAVAAEAVTVPPAERAAFVASHPDCLCNEFAELMIGMARERRGEAPRETIRLAHLAVTAVEAMAESGNGESDDLRALAWAELGNGHRICGDLRAAGTAFHHARRRLRFSSDPLTQSEVYSLEASYLDYRREFDDADRLLRRAERLERRLGTDESLAKIQIQRAACAQGSGRFLDAIDLLEAALRKLPPRENPYLCLAGIHNLAVCLIDLQAFGPALEIFRRFRPIYRAFGDPRFQVRRIWLQGRAHLGLGNLEESLRLLEDAHASFVALNSPYDVASVDLDLVAVYAREFRWEAVENAAAEALAICKTHRVDSEALAAAKLLYQAGARRQVSTETVGSLAAIIRRHLAPLPVPRD